MFGTNPFVDSGAPRSARMAGGRSLGAAVVDGSVDCDDFASVVGGVLVLAVSAAVPNDSKREKRIYE